MWYWRPDSAVRMSHATVARAPQTVCPSSTVDRASCGSSKAYAGAARRRVVWRDQMARLHFYDRYPGHQQPRGSHGDRHSGFSPCTMPCTPTSKPSGPELATPRTDCFPLFLSVRCTELRRKRPNVFGVGVSGPITVDLRRSERSETRLQHTYTVRYILSNRGH